MITDISCNRPGCVNTISRELEYDGPEGIINFTVWRGQASSGFGHAQATLCGVCANDLYDFWNAKTRSLKLS